MSAGIFQGLSVSPILYLFYASDLIKIFFTIEAKVTVVEFIDDFLCLEIAPASQELLDAKNAHFSHMALANRFKSMFDPLKNRLVSRLGKKEQQFGDIFYFER